MKTNYFILKDSGLHYVKDMPKIEERDELALREEIRAAIASSILLSNQEEVNQAPGEGGTLIIGEIYPLECMVEIKYFTDEGIPLAKGKCYKKPGEEMLKQLRKGVEMAFVALSGKEETKEDKLPEGRKLSELEVDGLRWRYKKYREQNPNDNTMYEASLGQQDAVTKEEEQDKEELRVFLYDCLKFGSKISYNQSILLTEKLLSNFIITKRQ